MNRNQGRKRNGIQKKWLKQLLKVTLVIVFIFIFLLQFVRFANIEEDTPSYHRRYDFFVSKFSSMCHSNGNDPELRDKIRLAGIRGLQVSSACISCYIIHVCKTDFLNIYAAWD
jgi:hypothetical protein